MKTNVIALKNYLSILKNRDNNIIEFTDNIEKRNFIESLEEFIELTMGLESRIEDLEKSGRIPKNKSSNTFVDVVLNRIVILKNIIQSKMGKPDDGLFSINLISVETIEQEISETNTVTKDNLEKLNKIYMSEISQF